MFHKVAFKQFVIEEGLVRYGEFVTKSGRKTTYFFDIGRVCYGAALKRLGIFYAQYIVANHILMPTIFGPSYKGISLALSTAMALSDMGYNIAFAYSRKELKHHGEGGMIIGAPLVGNVLIIDDVITSGSSIEESAQLIKNAGAVPQSAVVALDREERYDASVMTLARQQLEEKLSIDVHAMLTKSDLM